MIKVSVIVPVYNVEGLVASCLDRLVNQTIDDIEIIVINDGSTDASQSVIDDYAAQYPDKIKAYFIENRGAAGARNFALAHATGEYIGFVDSDDYTEADMFERMYDRAKKTDSDIVSCGYYRIVDGVGRKRVCRKLSCYGSNLYDEPKLLTNSVPYIWNKLFRRELIEKCGGFDESLRIYEDLVFTYKLFLRANKIEHVAEPFYCYSVSREESLTSTFSEKRFDIFKAADDLIQFYRENNAFEYFEDELLFILLKHFFIVMDYEVPVSSIPKKNKFINRAFQYLDTVFPWWRDYNYYYKKLKKNKKQYTSKLWWKSFFIIKKDTRLRYTESREDTAELLRMLRGKSLGGAYEKCLNLPLDEKAVIIQSQHGNNLNGNMFYILRELSKDKYRDYKLYVPYSSDKKAEFKALLKTYRLDRAVLTDIKSKEYARLLATSKYLFNDTSFAGFFTKREGQVYLNTWHGTPLKTLGKSSVTDFYDNANLQKNFVSADYLLYPNEYTRDHMQEDYMLPDIFGGKILLAGYPRNEIFYDDARRQKLKKKLKLEDKQVIAYMPTWRGNVRKVNYKKHVKDIQSHLRYLDGALGENQVMYVKFHPFVSADLDLGAFENIKAFPAQYETYDFLNVADILVTDYSSVMFDYSITGGKVILFTYDEEEYLEKRGVYFDFDKLPFARVNTVRALADEIKSSDKPDTTALCNQFLRYDCGNISEKICDMIIGGAQNELIITPCKPEHDSVFVFAGDALRKSACTDRLIRATIGANNGDKYRYYVSYVTDEVRRDTEELHRISQHIHFMGQYREFTNISKNMMLRLHMLTNSKWLYPLHKESFDKTFSTEFRRIFADIPMAAVIGFGRLETERVYVLSHAPCKKLLYLNEPSELNKEVNKSVYGEYDLILTRDKATADAVRTYCKSAKIAEHRELKSITELEQYI